MIAVRNRRDKKKLNVVITTWPAPLIDKVATVLRVSGKAQMDAI